MTVDAQAWTHLNCLEEGAFPALLWDTLKDFGYKAYPEYSAREIITSGQLFRWEVNVKVPVCPTHPTWEEWEVKAQGWKLAGTVQKAALEALTTFCEKHADLVASTAAKVIPLPKQHSGHGIKREAFLSSLGNPHYSPELDTSVRFSKAMLGLYQAMVGESMFYRNQIYRQQVNGAEAVAQELKEARATIARLKKKRRDKTTIQELSEVIHEQNFLLQHNDQYMLDLENQLKAVAAPPPNPKEEDPEKIQGESGVETGPALP
jgi:hypothetical protein